MAGKESFLQDETVRGSIHFFRYLEDPEKRLREREGGFASLGNGKKRGQRGDSTTGGRNVSTAV